MIDDIVEMILSEARTRKGPSMVSNIYSVSMEISVKIQGIMQEYNAQERRKKANETKTGNML
jgi:hypothetical protein